MKPTLSKSQEVKSPYLDQFSIRDLEEFSGVKAHTIRMWEKRYGLLRPDRTDTNIRTYGLDELKAILNISYLNQHGYKISKIAALSSEDRQVLVRSVAEKVNDHMEQLNTLKLAMLSYDEALFRSTSDAFIKQHGFKSLFEDLYVPLLERIGVLWQVDSICPAHEHFVSHLIRQRVIVATAELGVAMNTTTPLHVLYLPENEIHELGLLYVNYALRAAGKATLYLGPSLPRQDLRHILGPLKQEMVLISMLMVEPSASELQSHLDSLRAFLPEDRITFWLSGGVIGRAKDVTAPKGMKLFPKLKDLLASLD